MDLKTRWGLVVAPCCRLGFEHLKTQPMSTTPSTPVPKSPKQSPNTVSPTKKSENLKQTTLILSAAMVGDNIGVSPPLPNVISRQREDYKRIGGSLGPRGKNRRGRHRKQALQKMLPWWIVKNTLSRKFPRPWTKEYGKL